MKRPTGQYVTKRPEGIEDDAWIDDGTISMDIPESRYRDNQYQPDFDSLPWKEPDETA